MTEPLETAELQAFVRVVEEKSVSRAARLLQVPRATLGRRLSRLEERLGVRLLRRTTRTLALTDAGEQLYVHARAALTAVEAASQSVRRTDDGVLRGPLRVSIPPSAEGVFDELLLRFTAKHPLVRLQVLATTDLVDLVRDGYDVAIRASAESTPGVVSRIILRDRLVAVASPGYLEREGTPRTRADLARHRCVLGFAPGFVPATRWPTLDGGQLSVEGALVTNEISLRVRAALEGQGLALLPFNYLRRHLEAGRLVHVLPNVIGGEARVSVAFPDREFMPPQVRAFVDTVVVWAPKAMAGFSPRR